MRDCEPFYDSILNSKWEMKFALFNNKVFFSATVLFIYFTRFERVNLC